MKRRLFLTLALMVAILAVAGGVAGWRWPGRKLPAPTPREDGTPLVVEERGPFRTAESGVEGHHDFRFENTTDRPLTLGVEWKDCQCAQLQVWQSPDAWRALDADELRRRAADQAPGWQTLERDGQPYRVPPGAVGLVRLKWLGKKQGDQLFWASLWVDDAGTTTTQRVEILVHLVEPVRIRSEDDPKKSEVDLGPLSAGEQRTARFVCFSGTRDRFALSPPEPADPCISYDAPQPLTPAELQALAAKVSGPVLAGYRVRVTVRERAGEALADLGPFRRPVAWKTDVAAGHELRAHVSGSVRGEVRLADPADKAGLDLGKASAGRHKAVTFTLTSDDPALQLSLDAEKTLEFLEVELLDSPDGMASGQGKTWRVRVRTRPDALFRGRFPQADRAGYDSPAACSVVLRVSRSGVFLRRLLVPVRGAVAQD